MRVLIIEDEFLIAKAVRNALQRDGHDVTIAGTGSGGLDLVNRWRPDVVLLDLELPGMSGLDAIERLHSTVLVLTAYDTAEDVGVHVSLRPGRPGVNDFVATAPERSVADTTISRNESSPWSGIVVENCPPGAVVMAPGCRW